MVGFPIDVLRGCVRAAMPDCDAPVELEPITTGKFNQSFFADVGGRRLVLRIAPPRDSVFVFYERDMMRQEPGIHRLLLERTSVPVAPILLYDDSRRIVDRDYLVMERLPGSAISDTPVADVESVMCEVGRCLAQVHAIQAQEYGYLGEHRPMAPQWTWARAFEVMWGKLVDDVHASGHYDDAERDRFLAMLDRRLSLFDRAVPASLLHMDVWAQNILVDRAGRLSGLVDWDRALWGDPEIEFAVLDYCGIATPAFWRGYGRERDESPAARVRQVFYLLYEIQKYIVIHDGRHRDPASARRYKRQVMELVDQAGL